MEKELFNKAVHIEAEIFRDRKTKEILSKKIPSETDSQMMSFWDDTFNNSQTKHL